MQAVGNFFELVKRRIKGEPIQYIIGCQEFMGMDFRVDQRVLIPRRDTEILVEHVIRKVKEFEGPVHIVEVGTGSGAIAVSLAANLPKARVTAIDIDSGALEVAKGNATLHRVQERIVFLQGDLFEPLKDGPETGRFDVLVSNPPYIPTVEIETLEVQVKDYEPRIALDGGWDGLDFYKRLASLAPGYLKPGALWAVEVGYNQADAVKGILEKVGIYTEIQLIKDLSGIDRVVSARLAGGR